MERRGASISAAAADCFSPSDTHLIYKEEPGDQVHHLRKPAASFMLTLAWGNLSSLFQLSFSYFSLKVSEVEFIFETSSEVAVPRLRSFSSTQVELRHLTLDTNSFELQRPENIFA